MTTPRIVLPKLTIGLDLGDRYTQLCALDARGQIRATARLRTTPAALERHIATVPRCRMVLEVGTHSPWVSRLLEPRARSAGGQRAPAAAHLWQ